MNTKELAALLNGVEYGNEYHRRMREVEKMAKACGLVIAVGESDDLLEFYGAFRDEVGAPGVALIDAKGSLPSFESASEDEEAMRAYLARKETARQIEAVWCEEGSGYSWIIKTDIPHETFSIMEEGDPFSRGIVFALADLVQKPDACQGTNCGATDGKSHSVACLYEYALSRLGLTDTVQLRVLFWDAHEALVWDESTDWYVLPDPVRDEVVPDTRAEFEAWMRSVPFFAYVSGEALELDESDGGYLDAAVHAAWLAWNARGAK